MTQAEVKPFIFPEAEAEKMIAKFRHEVSFHGLSLDILKSGLQKYVRRSDPKKALWCAVEMDLFAYCSDKRSAAILTNLRHRLMIIFLEDVMAPELFPRLSGFVKVLLNASRDRAKT